MTLTIGKAYRLPNDGEFVKGIYVGKDEDGTDYFSTNNGVIFNHVWCTPDEVTEWREPRTWEDEVVIVERIADKKIQRLLRSDCDEGMPEENDAWIIVGRKTVTVTETMEG